MDALVHRLRGERDLFGGKLEQLGKNNAATWLATSSYLEIQNAATHNRPDGTHKYQSPRAAFSVMKQDMQILRTHNCRLLSKIEPNKSRPTIILTEQGVGYRLIG